MFSKKVVSHPILKFSKELILAGSSSEEYKNKFIDRIFELKAAKEFTELGEDEASARQELESLYLKTLDSV